MLRSDRDEPALGESRRGSPTVHEETPPAPYRDEVRPVALTLVTWAVIATLAWGIGLLVVKHQQTVDEQNRNVPEGGHCMQIAASTPLDDPIWDYCGDSQLDPLGDPQFP